MNENQLCFYRELRRLKRIVADFDLKSPLNPRKSFFIRAIRGLKTKKALQSAV
jgi:hypothetical protein